jgi:hypothetical protein
MAPQQGLVVQGLPLGSVVGHTDSALIPPAGLDGEIVVTASKKQRNPPFLILGRSALAGCSEIAAERASKTLTLRCGPNP